LVAALVRLDRTDHPMAETNRRLGAVAEHLGLTRPSYQQVRVVIHQLRAQKRGPGIGSVLLEIALRARPPEALVEALAGTLYYDDSR